MPVFQAIRISILLALGVCLSGCAVQDVAPGTRYLVKNDRAQFYKYGPAQSFGADLVLSQGTKVTVISRDFGYTRVMTEEGVAGYMSSEDLLPAPPEIVAKATPKPGVFSGRRRTSNVAPTPGDPLFDVRDAPHLPLPQESGRSTPKPGFRYPKPAPGFRY